ncbi:MAG: hypothetical protein J0I48_02400, partial [Devosia sp.]|nr:hypothetical protein [Devosia sp.]
MIAQRQRNKGAPAGSISAATSRKIVAARSRYEIGDVTGALAQFVQCDAELVAEDQAVDGRLVRAGRGGLDRRDRFVQKQRSLVGLTQTDGQQRVLASDHAPDEAVLAGRERVERRAVCGGGKCQLLPVVEEVAEGGMGEADLELGFGAVGCRPGAVGQRFHEAAQRFIESGAGRFLAAQPQQGRPPCVAQAA